MDRTSANMLLEAYAIHRMARCCTADDAVRVINSRRPVDIDRPDIYARAAARNAGAWAVLQQARSGECLTDAIQSLIDRGAAIDGWSTLGHAQGMRLAGMASLALVQPDD